MKTKPNITLNCSKGKMFYPETIHFVTTVKMTNRQERF